MTDAQSEFDERVKAIPAHGLGLSVDVYTPDLLELAETMAGHEVAPDYFEIFQAPAAALRLVKGRLADKRLAYHGEGLWITQPEFSRELRHDHAIAQMSDDLRTLNSAWLNLECATKQMGGFSFGTYVPPLYTEPGARMTAENVRRTQHSIDLTFRGLGAPSPLLLAEMPPLTYFVMGSGPIPGFYERMTREAACGLVLDIGHLWTVYRYTGAWRTRSLDEFTTRFLAEFPLERVVEIHVAGLGSHAAPKTAPRRPHDHSGLPRWIDAHARLIPSTLWSMLQQVLEDDRLINLKGIALEVDNKSIPDIVSESRTFRTRFEESFVRLQGLRSHHCCKPPRSPQSVPPAACMTESEKRGLQNEYERYALLVTGQRDCSEPAPWSCYEFDREDLAYYREVYLPNEILHWGGDLTDMFPDTCRLLNHAGIALADFVTFWFGKPRAHEVRYDFFLLKIDYFLEFVSMTVPAAIPTVGVEADALRAGYDAANQRMNVIEPIA